MKLSAKNLENVGQRVFRELGELTSSYSVGRSCRQYCEGLWWLWSAEIRFHKDQQAYPQGCVGRWIQIRDAVPQEQFF